jgi:hypothetical protein
VIVALMQCVLRAQAKTVHDTTCVVILPFFTSLDLSLDGQDGATSPLNGDE